MNVTAGKKSLVNESVEKEKIRRQRFVFPERKGSHIVELENECPGVFASQIRSVWLSVLRLKIRSPEIKELLVFFNRAISLDILRDRCSPERGSGCKGTIQTPFSSAPLPSCFCSRGVPRDCVTPGLWLWGHLATPGLRNQIHLLPVIHPASQCLSSAHQTVNLAQQQAAPHSSKLQSW